MDRCDDIATIQYTFRQAELHYARMVREHRASQARGTQSAQNPHIAHAIDYVYTHIHDRITVQDIADSIGLEPNYLSMLFHKCEKIPLKQYIQEEKVKWVKNLLVDSDYPYIDIAAYLGFASQSHMGQVFKKITGLTPRQYRERYRKDDFMAEHQM
jgi:YesN/AraC family two-component response regulator